MQLTEAQEAFVESDEPSLFLGSRQTGRTTAAVKKVQRLNNEGKSAVLVVATKRMKDYVESHYNANNVITMQNSDKVFGHQHIVIDEYDMMNVDIASPRIHATMTQYDGVHPFKRCAVDIGNHELHRDTYSHSGIHNSPIYNGHCIYFYEEWAECTICDMKYKRTMNPIVTIAQFYDPCPYMKIDTVKGIQ